MNSRKTQNTRAGLSLLEFIGCMISVVGGAWLGAIYLGVDVHSLSYKALEEAELLEKMPEKWRPLPPAGTPRRLTQKEITASLRDELIALRQEITSMRTAKNESQGAATPRNEGDPQPAGLTSPLQATKDKTRAYWKRITEIALGEAALQRDVESAFSEDRAAKVFALKGRVSRFAAKTVEAIPQEQVDDVALALGLRLAEWYHRGGTLYERAVQIWESPARDLSRKKLTKSWNQSQQQHKNEGQLLSNMAVGVRDTVSRRYQAEFPPFGGSTSSTTSGG